MAKPQLRRSPRWYGIPARVFLATLIGTLTSFAIGLLLGIIAIVILSALRGNHPDLRSAYRMIALPIACITGAIILVLSLVMEIRHYRQMKALSAIEKMG